MSDELKRLKADMSALERAYSDAGGRLSGNRNHCVCPFCKDETGFAFKFDEKHGNAWWRCHANKCGTGKGGTIVDLVMRARGLDSKEACRLVLERYGTAGTSATVENANNCSQIPMVTPQKKARFYPSVDEAAEGFRRGIASDAKKLNVRFTKFWPYTDDRGETLYVVARFDYEKEGDIHKKEFCPIHRDGNGWRLGRGPWGSAEQKCVLYGLRAITKAFREGGTKVLNVVEGEKCADELTALGMLATASQGGNGRVAETDWTPAARFENVVLWMDCDDPHPKTGIVAGETFVQDAAVQIAAAAVAAGIACPKIIVVDLRAYGLNGGQDVFDVIGELGADGKTRDEIRATLESLTEQYGRELSASDTDQFKKLDELSETSEEIQRAEIDYPGQPKPFAPQDGERPGIENFDWREKESKGEDGETKKKRVCLAASIAAVRGRILKASDGWPCRVKSPGARQPLLFVDEKSSRQLRWLTSSEQLVAWLQELGRVKFNPKQDSELTTYVKLIDIFHSFGGNSSVNEYLAVQARPHEPVIDGHYYMWRPPANYNADGKKLAGLLDFFSNAKDPVSRALIAAAFLTPGWGGPYGKRPAFVITAPDRGCGKSTLAWAIGKVWGGSISIDLSQRGEDQIVTRFLSPEAMLKVCPVIDNVKGTLSNAKIEALITDEWINGHALFRGDGSRPNVLTWIITANGVRLSRDMAQRSFFIELKKPEYAADWDKEVSEYVSKNLDFIVADAIAILKTARARASMKLNDRWARWCEEVLVPACEHVALADVAGKVSAKDVIRHNDTMRDDCDEDREEAEMLLKGLLDRVCAEAGLIYFSSCSVAGEGVESFPVRNDADAYRVTRMPLHPVFVTSDKMREHWSSIFGKKLNAKQVLHIIREHREAGRIDGISERHTKIGNGYELSEKLLKGYVDEVRETLRKRSSEMPSQPSPMLLDEQGGG